MLILEQRILHRELINEQIKKQKKFKVDNIDFACVQVQSKKKDGKVKKLSYWTRGPFCVVKVHNSGNYNLKLVNDEMISVIKKHDRNLYRSPQILRPFPHIRASDHQYDALDKKITSNP
eukprot:8286878-Ditylum_brightwellii.AAC.1